MPTRVTNPDVVLLLVLACGAAGLAALGALPLKRWPRIPTWRIGGAYGLASGLMLGVGSILLAEVLEIAPLRALAGAAVGVLFTHWTHVFTGTPDLSTEPGDESAPGYDARVTLQSTLHSSFEGVAMGIAFWIDTTLGAFTVAALATHNMAEGMVLAAVLRARGSTARHAAALCVVTNVPQVLLAIVTHTLVSTSPGLLPWAAGFAAGALLFLVLTELLPGSYERARRTAVALLVSAAAGLTILIHALLVGVSR